MATVRLALVNVVGAYEGPWFRPKGNEVGVEVSELVDGEELWLEMAMTQALRLQSGFTPFTFEEQSYRFVKKIDPSCAPVPTLVRIHLNGSAQNVSR